MITQIVSREQCTGCGACLNACPTHSIRMVMDDEGFRYPEVDPTSCTNCGTCHHVCPIIGRAVSRDTSGARAYACWNTNDAVRFQSASGGVFSALAAGVLSAGGVVFGAAYDSCMRVRHVAISCVDDLEKLRSSKYVQSEAEPVYTQVKLLLLKKIPVLFSGTPCQVAGLNAFVGRSSNLFTCDVLCHGVPSPGLFADYVRYLEERYRVRLVNLNFRHKVYGWKASSTMASFADGTERVLKGIDDSFMYGFRHDLSLRPICYRCPYARLERVGDLTLGDFWGIEKIASYNDGTRQGVSLVLVNSENGRKLFDRCRNRLFVDERTLDEVRHGQAALNHPWPEPSTRKRFFSDYRQLGFRPVAKQYLVDRGIKGLIKSLVPRTWIVGLRRLFG